MFYVANCFALRLLNSSTEVAINLTPSYAFFNFHFILSKDLQCPHSDKNSSKSQSFIKELLKEYESEARFSLLHEGSNSCCFGNQLPVDSNFD